MTFVAPLARWSMDDLSGTTMTDVSGNGRHGTYVGAPTLGGAGQKGTAVTFAQNKYASVSEAAWQRPAAALTVAAWVKSSTSAGANTVLARFNNANASERPFLLDCSGGPARFLVTNSAGTRFDAIGAATCLDGLWHRLVGTFDGASVKLYRDNVLVANVAASGTLQTTVITQGLGVGTRQNGSGFDAAGYYFPGLLDDVVFDDTAWTAQQVDADFSGHISGSLSASLPVLSASLVGDNSSVVGSWSAVLPGVTGSFDGVVSGQSVSTVTVDGSNGRGRGGRGLVSVEVPVVEPGPRVQRRPVRVITYTLPAPTLVDGRPV